MDLTRPVQIYDAAPELHITLEMQVRGAAADAVDTAGVTTNRKNPGGRDLD